VEYGSMADGHAYNIASTSGEGVHFRERLFAETSANSPLRSFASTTGGEQQQQQHTFLEQKDVYLLSIFPIIYLLLMVVDRISNSRFATFIRQKRQIATTTSSTIKDGVAPSLASIPGDAQKTEIENGDKKQG